MDKMVKVSPSTHKLLKIGASNSLLSMKSFIEKLAINNMNGIPFDVDAHSFETLISVFMDISEKVEKIKNQLSEEEKKEWKNTLDYVYL